MNVKIFMSFFIGMSFFVGSAFLPIVISEPLAIHQMVWGYIEYSDGSWVPSDTIVTITDLNNSNYF